MKVAKRFRWEAAHRLPWHEGDCKYVHGHSYRMMVELEGEPTEDTPGGSSMLIDFKHVKRLVKPLVDAMDHATIVAEDDPELQAAMEKLGSKTYELPFDSTAENLATHVARRLGTDGHEVLTKHGVTTIRVKVWETETCYAEHETTVDAFSDVARNGAAAHAESERMTA
jgi:6-pyruvoyltetrahydropterin/6-carboxytetrahydropterin synthase